MAEGNDKSVVEILIKMGLDPSGAEEAVNQINRVKAASKDDTGSTPEAWKSWEKYKNKLSEAGEEALSTHEKIHVLHLGLSEMGAKIPELGGLLHLIFNPMTAGFALGVAGIEAYFHWQEKVEERNKESIVSLQKINDEMRQMIAGGPTIQQNWIAITKTIAEARAAVQGLAYEMKEFENSSKIADLFTMDSIDRQIEKRKEETTIIEDQLDLLQQIGALNPQQAEEAKRREKEQADIDAAKDVVTKAQAEVSEAQTNRDTYASRAGDFSPEAQGAQQAKIQSDTEAVRRASDAVDNEQKYIDEQKKIISDQELRQKQHPLEWNDAFETIDAARKNIEDIKRRGQQGTAELPGLQQQLANDSAQLEAMKGIQNKVDDMDQNIRTLTQKLTDAQAALPQKVSKIVQSAAIKNVTERAAGGESIAEQFQKGAQAIAGIDALVKDNKESVAEIVSRGQRAANDRITGNYNPQDDRDLAVYQQLQKFQAQEAALRDLLTAVGDNADSVEAVINSAVNGLSDIYSINQSQQARMDTILIQINTLAQQFQSGGRPVTQ